MSDCFKHVYVLYLINVTSLLILYTLTLVRVIRGSSYFFLKQVIVMLMISNLGTLAGVFLTFYNCTIDHKSNTWNIAFLLI